MVEGTKISGIISELEVMKVKIYDEDKTLRLIFVISHFLLIHEANLDVREGNLRFC